MALIMDEAEKMSDRLGHSHPDTGLIEVRRLFSENDVDKIIGGM